MEGNYCAAFSWGIDPRRSPDYCIASRRSVPPQTSCDDDSSCSFSPTHSFTGSLVIQAGGVHILGCFGAVSLSDNGSCGSFVGERTHGSPQRLNTVCSRDGRLCFSRTEQAWVFRGFCHMTDTPLVPPSSNEPDLLKHLVGHRQTFWYTLVRTSGSSSSGGWSRPHIMGHQAPAPPFPAVRLRETGRGPQWGRCHPARFKLIRPRLIFNSRRCSHNLACPKILPTGPSPVPPLLYSFLRPPPIAFPRGNEKSQRKLVFLLRPLMWSNL